MTNMFSSIKTTGRKINIHKKAIRCLGIAESFRKNQRFAVLAGVVMRSDLIIDGVYLSKATIGGMDATEAIIKMFKGMKRNDIKLIMINGVVISYYNIIDLHEVYKQTGVPLISITYRESKGLENIIKDIFDDWEKRIEVYRKNGKRVPIVLKTGHTVFVRYLGLTYRDCQKLVNKFVVEGKHPEPIRIAKIVARSILSFNIGE